MSTNLVKPCRHSLTSNKKENEIREIFYGHWEKMKNQLETSINEIKRWRSEQIHAIDLYTKEQIQILQQDYERQQSIFDRKRDENLDAAKVYHKANENDSFNQLTTVCRSLEFQVAQLAYIQYETKYVKVVTVGEQIGSMKSNNTNANGLEFVNDRKGLVTVNGNSTMGDGGNTARSSVISKSSDSRDLQEQSLAAASFDFGNGSTDNTNNSGSYVKNNDDWSDKCPICFMIFPFSMSHDDRHQHVNEHMIDDPHPSEIQV